MQDIVFYAAANETLGVVRDYANARNQSAPVLTLGVSVCLRMRLFAATEGAAPYPIASFNSITDWKWSMDGDFDRSTACKLVADPNGISVHTVSDTINDETMSFTEFVISISNMNTQELAAWIGTEKTRSGLTGELVGYDSNENAAFVLQIENFTVRNRVAGLSDPTALDQEILTHSQAEQMIRTAVSSSAATKQDKLTPSNGGTGISVSSTGIISVSNVPQSAVTGLTASLAGKQNTLSAGCRMAIVNGSTVDQLRYFPIEPAITAPANQTMTVVLSAGKAYEIHVTASNAKVRLNCEEPVGGTHTFGLEGHLEIFVAGTGYVVTGTNVVLSQPLEPDAVNNCTVRFHDGFAIISVEDHIAGYVVTVGTGSTSGSLPYALGSASQEYVAFDASLNGTTLDLGGAVTNGEKHVVGNGYADTILTGGVSCTSKTTFANLAMSGVANSGETMTLGDVFIPSGATVSVSGGGLAVEKVTGNGGTIDLNGTNVAVSSGGTAYASGCTFAGGSAASNGIIETFSGTIVLRDVSFSSNIAPNYSIIYNSRGSLLLSGCRADAAVNTAGICIVDYANDMKIENSLFSGFSSDVLTADTHLTISGSTIGSVVLRGGAVYLGGVNSIGLITSQTATRFGNAYISSGATIHLASSIVPGGSVMIPPGAVVTIVGGGGSSGYFSELAVTGATVTDLGRIFGATVTVPTSGGPWSLETTEGTVILEAGETERSEVISGGVYDISAQ